MKLKKGGGGSIEKKSMGELNIVFWWVKKDLGIKYRNKNESNEVLIDIEKGEMMKKERFDWWRERILEEKLR